MSQASASHLPVHRVRFDAPATLTFSGYAETFAMAVTSLSAHGVGCSGPEGLVLGDRLQLAFALAPEEPATDFPCEVIWVEPAEEGTTLYGMRFVGLKPEREARLTGLLAERGHEVPLQATAELDEPQPSSSPADEQDEASAAAAGMLDPSELAAYSLGGQVPQGGSRGYRQATDLDMAIAEQLSRPWQDPLPVSSGHEPAIRAAQVAAGQSPRSEQSGFFRAWQAENRRFWVSAALGLVVGVALTLMVLGVVMASRPHEGMTLFGAQDKRGTASDE